MKVIMYFGLLILLYIIYIIFGWSLYTQPDCTGKDFDPKLLEFDHAIIANVDKYEVLYKFLEKKLG